MTTNAAGSARKADETGLPPVDEQRICRVEVETRSVVISTFRRHGNRTKRLALHNAFMALDDALDRLEDLRATEEIMLSRYTRTAVQDIPIALESTPHA